MAWNAWTNQCIRWKWNRLQLPISRYMEWICTKYKKIPPFLIQSTTQQKVEYFTTMSFKFWTNQLSPWPYEPTHNLYFTKPSLPAVPRSKIFFGSCAFEVPAHTLPFGISSHLQLTPLTSINCWVKPLCGGQFVLSPCCGCYCISSSSGNDSLHLYREDSMACIPTSECQFIISTCKNKAQTDNAK